MRLAELKNISDQNLRERLKIADDERMFILAEAFSRGSSIDDVWETTRIDKYFLKKMKNIIDFAQHIKSNELDKEILQEAKKMGFSDIEIAEIKGITENAVRQLRKEHNILPTYKLVDTCAAEFDAVSPYFYSCYELENEALHDTQVRKVLVVGSVQFE